MDACFLCESVTPPPGGLGGLVLGETERFRVVAEPHPLTEGHVLLVPKRHASAVGDLDPAEMDELKELLADVTAFLEGQYGTTAWFEHGVLGQTVPHAHVHVLPFDGAVSEIVPEGPDSVSLVDDVEELRWLLESEGGYLALGIGQEEISIVDRELAEPRFFRNRFAEALRDASRADWQAARDDETLMSAFGSEVASLRSRWENRIEQDGIAA